MWASVQCAHTGPTWSCPWPFWSQPRFQASCTKTNMWSIHTVDGTDWVRVLTKHKSESFTASLCQMQCWGEMESLPPCQQIARGNHITKPPVSGGNCSKWKKYHSHNYVRRFHKPCCVFLGTTTCSKRGSTQKLARLHMWFSFSFIKLVLDE